MTKHVFSNTREVCHAWANNSTDWGRNGTSSISFKNGRIFSYRTIIGVKCEKTGYILLNTKKYSLTTSGQQNDIYNAIPYDSRSKCISVCLLESGFDVSNVIDSFKQSVQSVSEKLVRARNKYQYYDKLDTLKHNIKLYKDYLLECQSLLLTDTIAYATSDDFAGIDALLESLKSYDNLATKAKDYLKKESERKKEILRSKQIEFETSLQEWREHKTNDVKHLYTFQDKYKTDFVRLSKDGKYFETHKNAKVPYNVGIALFRVCANIKNKCFGFETEFKFPLQFKNTPFQLNEVKADGSCVVGCHRFSFSELNTMCKIVEPSLAFND